MTIRFEAVQLTSAGILDVWEFQDLSTVGLAEIGRSLLSGVNVGEGHARRRLPVQRQLR